MQKMWGAGAEKLNCCPVWNLMKFGVPQNHWLNWKIDSCSGSSHAVMPSERLQNEPQKRAEVALGVGLRRMSSWVQVHYSSEIRAQSLTTICFREVRLENPSNVVFCSRKIQVGDIWYIVFLIYILILILIIWSSDQQWWTKHEIH